MPPKKRRKGVATPAKPKPKPAPKPTRIGRHVLITTNGNSFTVVQYVQFPPLSEPRTYEVLGDESPRVHHSFLTLKLSPARYARLVGGLQQRSKSDGELQRTAASPQEAGKEIDRWQVRHLTVVQSHSGVDVGTPAENQDIIHQHWLLEKAASSTRDESTDSIQVERAHSGRDGAQEQLDLEPTSAALTVQGNTLELGQLVSSSDLTANKQQLAALCAGHIVSPGTPGYSPVTSTDRTQTLPSQSRQTQDLANPAEPYAVPVTAHHSFITLKFKLPLSEAVTQTPLGTPVSVSSQPEVFKTPLALPTTAHHSFITLSLPRSDPPTLRHQSSGPEQSHTRSKGRNKRVRGAISPGRNLQPQTTILEGPLASTTSLMAPVKDPNDVSTVIKDVIDNLYDVQSKTHGYIPETQDLLVDRIADLTGSLSHLRDLTDPRISPNNPIHNVRVPPEIVDYVDDGRNPDIFTRDFVENVQRGNAVINGKKQAFEDFSVIFAKKLKEGISGIDQHVDRIMEQAGLEKELDEAIKQRLCKPIPTHRRTVTGTWDVGDYPAGREGAAENQPESSDMCQHSLPRSVSHSNTAQSRLNALHASLTMSSSPITCHVLNTVAGTPAANLKATLTLLAPVRSADNLSNTLQPAISFSAVTNEDGRVKEWDSASGSTLQSVLEPYSQGEKVPFSIRFDVGPWYESQGVESFWPEVEVKFYVKKGERHYHVPVLVGPWTYTTYRGS